MNRINTTAPLTDAALARVLGRWVAVLGAVIAISGPAGFWWLSQRAVATETAIAARLHAAFLIQAIGGDAEGWKDRVTGLIDDSVSPSRFPEQRRIEGVQGQVLASSGVPVAEPVLARVAPLGTAEGPLGQVVVARSLRPLLWETALVALLSATFGAAVYALMRLLPLRAMRRLLERLHEQELQARFQAEEQLRVVLDNAMDGVIIFEPDGRLVSANPAMASMLGCAPAGLSGQPFGELMLLPHDDALLEDRFETTLKRDASCGDLTSVEVTISRVQVGERDHRIAIVRDVTERLLQQARLSQLANYDSLTGLPNRELFRDRLQQAIARARRSRRLAAVMFIDLDRFKQINDTFGHATGDELLIAVAGRLMQRLRESDSLSTSGAVPGVFRLGGDEFTVLLEDMTRDTDAALVAQRLLQALSQPFALRENEFYVSASIGIALHAGNADIDVDTLLKQADLAMYRAKDKGRDGYHFFNEELNQDLLERHRLEMQLRRALERQEFELHYQPKVDARSLRIKGVEALLRWHPAGEPPVSPAVFIPILEDCGLIVPVGAWVVREACRQVQAWRGQGLPALPVAVNLSARQFRQPDLAAFFAHTLKETGLPADLLEVELTESMLIDDTEQAMRVLHELGDLGLRIAIDDFGTGHSSLAYLKRFDVDILKIDRTFVRDTPDDPEDCAISRAVVSLAHGLGLKVVAEGVENERQRQFLVQLGCEELQGFLFSKPVPAAALAELLRSQQPLLPVPRLHPDDASPTKLPARADLEATVTPGPGHAALNPQRGGHGDHGAVVSAQ